MAKYKLLAMNIIAFSYIQRSAVSWSTHSWNKVPSSLSLIRIDALYASSQTSAPSSPEATYILRFGSHIHKYSKDTGIGIAVYDAADGKKLWEGRRFIPVVSAGEKTTSNVADYIALTDGLTAVNKLKSAQTLSSPCRIEIQTSNRVIAKHLSQEFKVATKSLKPWYETATKLMGNFENVATGQISSSDTDDIKKASKLAIQEQKSCDNYLEVVAGTKNNVQLGEDVIDSGEGKEVHTTEQKEPKETQTETKLSEIKESQASTYSEISPDKVYILRFDGGSRGNPGIAGSGMALYDSVDGSEIWSGCVYLGDQRTNNEAEYMGLITGMQCALSLGVKQIVVQGDSKLVLEQVALRWKVKSPSLKHYFDEAINLKKQFAYFETSHIERAKNARADELANEAMDTRCSKGFET